MTRDLSTCVNGQVYNSFKRPNSTLLIRYSSHSTWEDSHSSCQTRSVSWYLQQSLTITWTSWPGQIILAYLFWPLIARLNGLIYNSSKRPNSTLESNLIRLCFQPLNIEGFLLHHVRLCLSVDTCSRFKLFLTNLQFLNKLTGTTFLGTSNDLDR